MQHSPDKPTKRVLDAFLRRLSEALCLPVEVVDGFGDRNRTCQAQKGSAVVEFTFLAVLLMVPLVYFVVTVGQIQGGSFAVVGAADQAAKVFVTRTDATGARAAAEGAVLLAVRDYGHTANQASVDIACDRADCLSAGASVTVTVGLDVPLPMLPFADSLHLNAARLSASSTQVVGRYQ
ncbi:hypothetical protein LN996_00660 [Arthrobacter sp. AK01]|uniref:hypothetical protein n=1 Tax=Micrococcaceae TaxID=1268 RepID=UPI001E64D986|nr:MULTISPECIES: hypothetical protein [Micrococcaceae]MCD4849312.1 hypothetical protein [Arthrobacter sp. AK01]MCP1414682.1 Flp pilus assembly protein TadG [Paenarthrobacter sp. A20]